MGAAPLRAVAVVATATLAACMPQAVPAVPGGLQQMDGPTLTLEVTNRTDETHLVEYEYEGVGMAGGGGGEVPCGRSVITFGQVSGSYAVTVDGEQVAAGEVPRGVDRRLFIVFRITIDEGETTALGPAVVADPPREAAALGEECG